MVNTLFKKFVLRSFIKFNVDHMQGNQINTNNPVELK